jgi:hypothetical protein
MLAGVTTVGPPRVVAVEGASRGWRGGHSCPSNPAPYTTWLDTNPLAISHGPRLHREGPPKCYIRSGMEADKLSAIAWASAMLDAQ